MKASRVLLWSLAFLCSCSEVFEEDISGMAVAILQPTAGDTIKRSDVSLSWTTIEGVDSFKVLLEVAPADSNFEIRLDTLTVSQHLQLSLSTGIYRFSVQGVNSFYESENSMLHFVVDTNRNIKDLQPILLHPKNGSFLNTQGSLTFDWADLEGAEQYEFLLYEKDNPGNVIAREQALVASTYTLNNALADGQYTWEVDGRNYSSISGKSSGSFEVDQQVPSLGFVRAPSPDAIFSDSIVSFEFSPEADGGSPLIWNIKLFQDSGGVFKILERSTVELPTELALFPQVYYWRYTVADSAGNTSQESPIYRFTIQ